MSGKEPIQPFKLDYEEVTRTKLSGNHVFMSRAIDQVISNINGGHKPERHHMQSIKRLNRVRRELLHLPPDTNFADHFVEIAFDELHKNSKKNILVDHMLEAVIEINKMAPKSRLTTFMEAYSGFREEVLVPDALKFTGDNGLLYAMTYNQVGILEEEDAILNQKLAIYEPTEEKRESVHMDCKLRIQSAKALQDKAMRTVRGFNYADKFMEKFNEMEIQSFMDSEREREEEKRAEEEASFTL